MPRRAPAKRKRPHRTTLVIPRANQLVWPTGQCLSSPRANDRRDVVLSDSAVSSASDSEYQHSSHKRKKRSDRLPSSSKHKKHDSPSPPPPPSHRVDESAVNDHNVRPASSSKKSPKRTILITPSNDRKKEDTGTRTAKDEVHFKERFSQASVFLLRGLFRPNLNPSRCQKSSFSARRKSTERRSPMKPSISKQKATRNLVT